MSTSRCAVSGSAFIPWKLLMDGTVDAFFTPARTLDHNMFGSINLYQTNIMLGAPLGCAIVEKRSLGISDILDLPLGYLNAPMPVEKILNAWRRDPKSQARKSHLWQWLKSKRQRKYQEYSFQLK